MIGTGRFGGLTSAFVFVLTCAAVWPAVVTTGAQAAEKATRGTDPKDAGEVIELERNQTLAGGEAPAVANVPFQVRAIVGGTAGGGGVVASQGAQQNGWSLYVRDAKPIFAVRRGGTLFELEPAAGRTLRNDEDVELVGELRADGTARILLNGIEAARGNAGGLIPAQPSDPLIVGNDLAGAVGDYKTPHPYRGAVRRAQVVTVAIDLPDRRTHAPLITRWGRNLDPANVLPEYPRPQLVRQDAAGRPDWTNLNGRWAYAIRPVAEELGAAAEHLRRGGDGHILVPFAAESHLSGVRRMVGREHALWYRRTFDRPKAVPDGRLLLHFGGVDWHATVWVNGRPVGEHKGCFDPFALDVTDALTGDGPQELVVRVWDPTDTGHQARGKQVESPRGIWYTPVTGIWQTVWLEPVPVTRVTSIKPVVNLEQSSLTLQTVVDNVSRGDQLRAELTDGGQPVAKAEGPAEGPAGWPLDLRVGQPKLWSPDAPHLYDLTVEVVRGGRVVDRVVSYAAMRTVAVRPDEQGVQRLFLNGRPLFQYGPLDQGWWPEGLYTAPTDEALRYDVEATKRMGFNMIRKHVKVEPARWYHHCDKLGMLVWQDIVGGFPRPERGGPGHVEADAPADWDRPADSAELFEHEMRQMIRSLDGFPSVVCWVVFNEGWGQFDTPRIVKQVEQLDPTRMVNGVSGWRAAPVGHMEDAHHYPGPGMEPPAQHPGRAVVLGEFGGLGLPVEKHLWRADRNWGYQSFGTAADLERRYAELVASLGPMIDRGLAAAVYTQTTDVEVEVNGLLTYDREVTNIDPARLRALHAGLYQPAGRVRWYAADAEAEPQEWRRATRDPGEGWASPGFDDAAWERARAPFATAGAPFVAAGTPWDRGPLWLRRSFTLDGDPLPGLSLRFFTAGEVEVYLNGVKIYERLRDQRVGARHYTDVDISRHAGLLRKGANVLGVAARPVGARHAVDVGLYGHARASVGQGGKPHSNEGTR